MGLLVGSQCYTSPAVAEAVHFGSLPVALALDGKTETFYTWTGSAWRFHQDAIAVNGSRSVNFDVAVPSVAFPVCDEAGQFSDGVSMGWGLAPALVAAWGVRLIIQYLK